MKVIESFTHSGVDFKCDVTQIVKNIIGDDLVVSAIVTLEHVEDFKNLSDKKQNKIRNRVNKYANNIENEAKELASLMTPGDGMIEIFLVNGKRLYCVATGGEGVHIMDQDTIELYSNGLI